MSLCLSFSRVHRHRKLLYVLLFCYIACPRSDGTAAVVVLTSTGSSADLPSHNKMILEKPDSSSAEHGNRSMPKPSTACTFVDYNTIHTSTRSFGTAARQPMLLVYGLGDSDNLRPPSTGSIPAYCEGENTGGYSRVLCGCF